LRADNVQAFHLSPIFLQSCSSTRPEHLSDNFEHGIEFTLLVDLLLPVSADLSSCLSPGSAARADTGATGVRSLTLVALKAPLFEKCVCPFCGSSLEQVSTELRV
jgi:queuine/archaeosine tRNA-ribosyltransferase